MDSKMKPLPFMLLELNKHFTFRKITVVYKKTGYHSYSKAKDTSENPIETIISSMEKVIYPYEYVNVADLIKPRPNVIEENLIAFLLLEYGVKFKFPHTNTLYTKKSYLTYTGELPIRGNKTRMIEFTCADITGLMERIYE